jgi:hypothetical protein
LRLQGWHDSDEEELEELDDEQDGVDSLDSDEHEGVDSDEGQLSDSMRRMGVRSGRRIGGVSSQSQRRL